MSGRQLAQLARLPVTELRGIGPKSAGALERAFAITSVLDLLMHYPRRYVDRTNQQPISSLAVGEQAMVLATVKRISGRRTRGRPPRSLVVAEVTDGTGFLKITFFNQAWRERQLAEGTSCVVFGKVDHYQGRLQMTNPIVDLVGDQTGRIVPMYRQSEKERITSSDVSTWMVEVLARSGAFAETVPDSILAKHKLIGRSEAFTNIHGPDSMEAVGRARRRLVFDELFRMQLVLVRQKMRTAAQSVGIAHHALPGRAGKVVDVFVESLPFPLTGAQQRVIEEITADLAAPAPMHRLLQGDVGAGKTIVALHALLTGVESGYQGLFMAPTEVLAEQHHAGVSAMLAGLKVPDDTNLLGERAIAVELLSNRVGAADRRRIAQGLSDGMIDIVIGTHALIEEGFAVPRLGVVVIDEQHRFGVEQRDALRTKTHDGTTPDVLVMTATPIPRTAAMTVYGDLDVSVLDELPPGRTPIRTQWVANNDAETAWEALRTQIGQGRQGYVVCPLIEGSEKLQAASAQETQERLAAPGGPLEGCSVGLLHGRLNAAEKNDVMDRFRDGTIDVLVATTVIEVGVDVPNATVMVILDADRFGIAQLHQLRGRVGRGAHESVCFLVADATTPEGEARMEALVASTDGFALAEVDLDLRGEGTLMANRQSGRNDLRLASLRRDRDWVRKARHDAEQLLRTDPELASHQALRDEIDALLGEDEAEFLFKS